MYALCLVQFALPKLTAAQNPERIMGGAAFFGLTLISGSKLVASLAMASVAGQ